MIIGQKYVTSRPCNLTDRNHCPTRLSYQGNKCSTKFHEHFAKNVTSRVFTCFHCIHIQKNAPPTGGHVFSPICIIFNSSDISIKTIVFTRKTAPPTGGHLHEDWALNVTSTVFELDRDIIGTNLLTKFHKDRTINVASRVFTNTCGRTTDKDRKTTLSPWQPFLTKFHENWAKNMTSNTNFHDDWAKVVTSRVFTRKTGPPTGGHVFQRTGITF
ncbi:hypothetical protein DPMN_187484 [Dreissena polymorpha]|uniref:Uncharacterized protein n=1 Tax=Dreissena polymorpha TaxID=45954 RepID=A0A9D4IAE3_DREPO|nr:hypothetical protein DPMN_187484 [Dreissena polymorpha]